VPDDRVGIEKTKSPPSGQLSTNGRLSRSHEPDQNDVAIGVNKIHGASIVQNDPGGQT
jgi:hypothetical protein